MLQMSRVISRHTLRCLELAILVTVLNLLLSFCVVQWWVACSASKSSIRSKSEGS